MAHFSSWRYLLIPLFITQLPRQFRQTTIHRQRPNQTDTRLSRLHYSEDETDRTMEVSNQGGF